MAAVCAAHALALFAKLRFLAALSPRQRPAWRLPCRSSLGLQFVEERLISREAHAQREHLMRLFSSYVDPAVADTHLAAP